MVRDYDSLKEYIESDIPPEYVKDIEGMSYLEHWAVKTMLNECFGYLRWRFRVLETQVLYAEQANGTWDVGTMCRGSLQIFFLDSTGDENEVEHVEIGTGSSSNLRSRGDAYGVAIKGAASDAFKRCAHHIGPRFGLSLYQKPEDYQVMVGPNRGKKLADASLEWLTSYALKLTDPKLTKHKAAVQRFIERKSNVG